MLIGHVSLHCINLGNYLECHVLRPMQLPIGRDSSVAIVVH